MKFPPQMSLFINGRVLADQNLAKKICFDGSKNIVYMFFHDQVIARASAEQIWNE